MHTSTYITRWLVKLSFLNRTSYIYIKVSSKIYLTIYNHGRNRFGDDFQWGQIYKIFFFIIQKITLTLLLEHTHNHTTLIILNLLGRELKTTLLVNYFLVCTSYFIVLFLKHLHLLFFKYVPSNSRE